YHARARDSGRGAARRYGASADEVMPSVQQEPCTRHPRLARGCPFKKRAAEVDGRSASAGVRRKRCAALGTSGDVLASSFTCWPGRAGGRRGGLRGTGLFASPCRGGLRLAGGRLL